MSSESTETTAPQQPTLDQLATLQSAPSELTSPIPIINHSAQVSGVETAIFRDGNDLILAGGAVPPSNVCLKSGKAVKTVMFIRLSHPLKPQTWFGGDKIAIGLSPKSLEKFRINQALALSLIILGVLMVPLGLISGVGTAIAGLIVCLAGLVFRSLFPVWAPSRSKEAVTVRGCGERFLRHFSEKV